MPGALLTPVMTSATTPSGFANADSYGGSDIANCWRWFQHIASPLQLVPYDHYLGDTYVDKNPPHWLSFRFDQPTEVASFQFHFSAGSPIKIITDVTFQALDSSDLWVDLLTVNDIVGVQGSWSDVYQLQTTGMYNEYRILVLDWVTTVDDTWSPDWVRFGGLALYGQTYEYEIPALNLPLNFNTVTHTPLDVVTVPALDLPSTLHAAAAAVGPIDVTVPTLPFSLVLTPPRTTLIPETILGSSIVYRITITGTDDLILPISSLQMRLRSTGESFVSIVVPDGTAYAAGIAANANGNIVVERGLKFSDGGTQYVELARAAVDDIRDDGGGNNRSITLSARAPMSWGSPVAVALKGVTYRANSNSGRRFRADLDLNLRPGDTATTNGESMVVDTITYIVSTKGEMMEINEVVA